MLQRRPLIVGLGGSPRPHSSTDKALMIALATAEDCGADTKLIPGTELQLPLYGAGDGEMTPAAMELIEALRRCDGLLLASPAYHGSLSGLLKNALDYVEALREADAPYLDNKPVGCIVCAYGSLAMGTTLVAMRSIVHALRGWPAPMGVGINATAPFVDGDGTCSEKTVKLQLDIVARQVVEFAQMQIAWRESRAEERGMPKVSARVAGLGVAR